MQSKSNQRQYIVKHYCVWFDFYSIRHYLLTNEPNCTFTYLRKTSLIPGYESRKANWKNQYSKFRWYHNSNWYTTGRQIQVKKSNIIEDAKRINLRVMQSWCCHPHYGNMGCQERDRKLESVCCKKQGKSPWPVMIPNWLHMSSSDFPVHPGWILYNLQIRGLLLNKPVTGQELFFLLFLTANRLKIDFWKISSN